MLLEEIFETNVQVLFSTKALNFLVIASHQTGSVIAYVTDRSYEEVMSRIPKSGQ